MSKYLETEAAYKRLTDFIISEPLLEIDLVKIILESKEHLLFVKLKELGLNIERHHIANTEYNSIGEYVVIGIFGTETNRTISWEDDNKQPINELLLNISFCTGAYIFGDDYPTKLFKEFFNELKTYNPKYIDSANKSLYFDIDNCADVFNNFNGMYEKYMRTYQDSAKSRRIEKLQEEINKLKE